MTMEVPPIKKVNEWLDAEDAVLCTTCHETWIAYETNADKGVCAQCQDEFKMLA